MQRPLDVAWLTSLEQVGPLEREWRTLADRAPGVTPFQYPDWILPWYQAWAADRIQVLTARNGCGDLCGLVPAVVEESRLELAGSGVGDYLAPVVLDTPDALAPAFDAALASLRLPVRFRDVPADAGWALQVQGMARWRVEPASPCPVAALPASVEAWRHGLPSGLRRNLRRYRQRLQDDADARFETIADERQVPVAMKRLFALHTKRWHERGLPGVLGNDRVRAFHTAAAPALVRNRLLRLHLLHAGGEVIGVQYVLVRGTRAYSYLGGFDPSWDAYSPGSLLMAYAIEQAIGEGRTEFDFLRGREPYKYQWGATDRCSLSLCRDVAA